MLLHKGQELFKEVVNATSADLSLQIAVVDKAVRRYIQEEEENEKLEDR